MKFRLLFLFALIITAAQGWASGNEPAVISASVETLDFGAVEVGYPVTKTFSVTGYNLSDNISLEVTGRHSSYYKVTPSTITPEQAAGGVTVSVKCSPSSNYITNASIQLTASGAEDVIIPIAVDPYFPAERFYDGTTEEFTASVGQFVTRRGTIRFADAQIPPDPGVTPAVRSNRNRMIVIDIDASLLSPDYSLSIEGTDRSQFSAKIVKSSSISKVCTVIITYAPRFEGTHNATLNVNCSRAGVPWVTIPLHGECSGVLCDLDGNGVLDVTDLTHMITAVLHPDGESRQADFNEDGVSDVDDVTEFITFLLNEE